MKNLFLFFASCFLCFGCSEEISRKKQAQKAKNRNLISENETYHFKNKYGDTLTLDKRRISGFQHAIWIFRGDTLHGKNNLDNTNYRLADGTPFRASFNEPVNALLEHFNETSRQNICLSNAELRTLLRNGVVFNATKNYSSTLYFNDAPHFFTACYIRRLQLDDDAPWEYIAEYDMAFHHAHIYIVYDFDGKIYNAAQPLALGNRYGGADSVFYDRKTKFIGLCEHGWGSGYGTQEMGLYQFKNDSLENLVPSHPINGSQCLMDIFSLDGFALTSNSISGNWIIHNQGHITFSGTYSFWVEPDNKPEVYLLKNHLFQINYLFDKASGQYKWVSGDSIPLIDNLYFPFLGGDMISFFEPSLRQNLLTGIPQQQKYIRRYFKNKQKP